MVIGLPLKNDGVTRDVLDYNARGRERGSFSPVTLWIEGEVASTYVVGFNRAGSDDDGLQAVMAGIEEDKEHAAYS